MYHWTNSQLTNGKRLWVTATLLGVLLLATTGPSRAGEGDRTSQSIRPDGGNRGVTRITIPDDKVEATQVLKDWLTARGVDYEGEGERFAMRKGGVRFHLTPSVHKGELDRIHFYAIYQAKEEHRGTAEMDQLASKLTASQTLLRVFALEDGRLIASGNLTFFDELTAREFDAFVDLFPQVVRRYILTEEALRLLK